MPRKRDNSDVDPQRFIGRWAMVHDHTLFRIEAAMTDGREVRYHGTGLRGQAVTTGFPVSILRAEDEEWINGKVDPE